MSKNHAYGVVMSKKLPPLYALRAFESAAKTNSFTLAADELSITQSAISRHIKTLENYFNCQLFTRHGPRLEVTPQGKIFAAELRKGFKLIEDACELFLGHRNELRLKAPSTLTMRWLLDCLSLFRQKAFGFEISITSVWMDIDSVDFFSEPYDCAILLGNGFFGEGTKCVKLFDEWLIPICSPSMLLNKGFDIKTCELIHPSPDRRDWRRWLKKTDLYEVIDINKGKVFDTLEQGNTAAICGHGVSVGDLFLCVQAINDGQLVLPLKTAVKTGDGYYLVWPENLIKDHYIKQLHEFLINLLPDINNLGVDFRN